MKGKCFVVGHSFGTSLAMELAAARPKVVTRLVLVGSAAAVTAPVGLFSLPVCLLRCLQSFLVKGFIGKAFHPSTLLGRTEYHRSMVAWAQASSQGDPMHMCKAFYTVGFVWAHKKTIEAVQVRAEAAQRLRGGSCQTARCG